MFVFRIILFVVVLKCLVSFVYTESTSLPETPNESKIGQTLNSTKTNDVITSVNTTQDIPTVVAEGGEKFVPVTSSTVINLKSTTEQSDINNDTSNASTETTRGRGREGELIHTTEEKNNSSNNTKIEDQNIEKKHNGREGELIPVQEKKNVTSDNTGDKTSSTVSDNISKLTTEKPLTTDSQETKTTHRRIFPKKGVNFTEIVNTDNINVTSSVSTQLEVSSTTIKTTIQPSSKPEKIQKPTVTTGSEDKGDTSVKQKSNNSTPKVPTIEYYQKKNEEESKRSNFIIPIVAVIFSVPIVAIILNITYKRCKEWWSHRHYSRMDFLIDGMYNN